MCKVDILNMMIILRNMPILNIYSLFQLAMIRIIRLYDVMGLIIRVIGAPPGLFLFVSDWFSDGKTNS